MIQKLPHAVISRGFIIDSRHSMTKLSKHFSFTPQQHYSFVYLNEVTYNGCCQIFRPPVPVKRKIISAFVHGEPKNLQNFTD